MTSQPTQEQVDDLLLACRYGDIEDVQAFINEFGAKAVEDARDERGNTVLHMCCGNGHADILELLLPLLPASAVSQLNESKSPPLHWAILNSHLNCVKALVELPEEKGGGLPLLEVKNASGRDAFDESMWAGEGREEVSGWIEGYLAKALGEDAGDADGSGQKKVQEVEEVQESQEMSANEGDEVVDRTEKLSLDA